MDTKALPQITLAIWEKGGSSALNRHTVVERIRFAEAKTNTIKSI
jgi:hypothetical protein